MGHGISMRELQKMSAGAISRLKSLTPIRNGSETVALLLPVEPLSREQIEALQQRIDSVHARWSEEDHAELDRMLRERGSDL